MPNRIRTRAAYSKTGVANHQVSSRCHPFQIVSVMVSYLLLPSRKTVHLAFKFHPTKIICLGCSKVHLIKEISNIKKKLHWEGHGATCFK